MLHLGIIYKRSCGESYKAVNHRSLLKLILNPILRKLGYFINSIYDEQKDSIVGLEILKLDKPYEKSIVESFLESWIYPFSEVNMRIKKQRIIF